MDALADALISLDRPADAVPFLERAGGRRIGRLDEEFPVIGALVSEIWIVERQGYYFCRENIPDDFEARAWAMARAAVAALP